MKTCGRCHPLEKPCKCRERKGKPLAEVLEEAGLLEEVIDMKSLLQP